MEGQPWLQQGDEVVCEIDGLGKLVNQVRTV
jgi:2-keto-4-pentenoate hydratase/2-oxohepta-3-ene-1,7-dioic acid hydratase in catechol pathway